MKRIVIGVICVAFCQISFAQTSGNLEVVGSAGEVLKTKDGSVSFTIGEIAIQQMVDSSDESAVSEGFQQIYFWITPLAEESTFDFEVKIWPNPTVRFINIDLRENKDNQNIKAEIYSLLGVKLDEFLPFENPQIDLTTYPVSSYILRIYNTDNLEIKVFKITKM
tara:strand:+ start:160 stop:654 length:495 start_codon:yes stop_codon:yes gene_type:complete